MISQCDPRLIFNADETSSVSSKKFKALILNKKSIAAMSTGPNELHITALLSYNAQGFKLKPYIILSEVKSIPDELKDLDAFFTSQASGWMTSHLFYAFCVFFVGEVNKYRLELPDDIRNKPIILLCDNHPSRFNSNSIEFLAQHNIQLITFPAHCTHVLQPFDVSVAYPFKINLSSFRMSRHVRDYAKRLKNQTARARYITVSSIINSWNSVPIELLKKSFEATGILPYDPKIPLNNPNTNQSENVLEEKKRNLIEMSSQLLTSDDNILKLHNQEYGTFYINTNQIPKIKYSNVKEKFTNYCIYRGMVFTSFPIITLRT